jgi:diacylglycerol kinase (ATP)
MFMVPTNASAKGPSYRKARGDFASSRSLTSVELTDHTRARMSGIGVVFNPKSRHNLRDPGAADRLARRLGKSGTVREARSIDELHCVAEDFRRQAIDILAISGGDGTNTVTLTGFLDAYADVPLPPIALLRGGTMNTVASSVGVLRGTPEALLDRLVTRYTGRADVPLAYAERRILRVAPDGGGPAHYGFLFGAGVVHGFLAEYYAGGEPTPLVAAQTLARGIASALVGGEMIRRMAKPFHGSVTLEDGARWPERDYLAVAAGTVAHIGLQFMPFYRFDERPETFHVLGIYASPAQFAIELPRIHRGKPMREGRAYEALSTQVCLQSTEGPLKYMVDGDLHEAPAAMPAQNLAPPASGSDRTAGAIAGHGSLGGRVTVSMGPSIRLIVEAEKRM